MASSFKLKDLTTLDNLQNGQKQEVEVEGVEEGKVLLAKIKDQVHVLGSKCTHYGAPLAKGVLTADGRLTCPWHGACFSVATGDVEDAPALDPIAKFEVVEKEGGVFITGDEGSIKGGRRGLSIKCSPRGQEKVVIVGSGSGAVGAIEQLRKDGFAGGLHVFPKRSIYLLIARSCRRDCLPMRRKCSGGVRSFIRRVGLRW